MVVMVAMVVIMVDMAVMVQTTMGAQVRKPCLQQERCPSVNDIIHVEYDHCPGEPCFPPGCADQLWCRHAYGAFEFGIQSHMGQFLQGGKNGRLMSFFFLKVEPPCDQT